MAGELQYYGHPSTESGLTVTARVYDSSGAQTGSDVSCTETGTLAIYIGTMPTAAAGAYGIRFFDSAGTLLGQGPLFWDGTNETTAQTLAATLALLETEADAATRAATNQSEHDATQAAVAGLASPLDAAGVRAAVGLASANLDTQLAALPTDADVQTAAGAAITAAEPVSANLTQVAGVAVSGASDLQADTSALATQASVDVIDANVDAILVDTGTTIPARRVERGHCHPADPRRDGGQRRLDGYG